MEHDFKVSVSPPDIAGHCTVRYGTDARAETGLQLGGMKAHRWMLFCADCKKEFTHSEVADGGPFSAWTAIKPDFPEAGLQIECPNCRKAFVYQRYELVLRTT
jgi:hypothetical protein